MSNNWKSNGNNLLFSLAEAPRPEAQVGEVCLIVAEEVGEVEEAGLGEGDGGDDHRKSGRRQNWSYPGTQAYKARVTDHIWHLSIKHYTSVMKGKFS